MKVLRGLRSLLLGWIVVALAALGYSQASRPQLNTSASNPSVSAQREFLNQYCVSCHNERAKTAGLLLDKMDLADIPAGAEVWEKVIRKVRIGMMPPQGMPRPDQTTQ